MELYLNGDYYEWYCEWCDTRNLTLIHRVPDGAFSCYACHKRMIYQAPVAPRYTNEFRPAA
jgi:hypothetical protein